MDQSFWIAIAKNDYKIPEGHTLEELTKALFGYLGNTDPEIRDDIGYIVFANFLKREMYSQEDIQTHIKELLSNLEKGIGDTGTDTIFLRTFSVLFLAEIVYNDNKKPLLEKEQTQSILAKALWYLGAEKDPRGYIPVKGWAHALAHTADLLQQLGKNRSMEKEDLEKLLQGIAAKLVNSTDWTYIHGEDERLANSVIAILQRSLVSIEFLKNWLRSITEPEKSWKGAYMEEGKAKAFHNTRNFLRSTLIAIRSSKELNKKDELESLVFDSLINLKPY